MNNGGAQMFRSLVALLIGFSFLGNVYCAQIISAVNEERAVNMKYDMSNIKRIRSVITTADTYPTVKQVSADSTGYQYALIGITPSTGGSASWVPVFWNASGRDGSTGFYLSGDSVTTNGPSLYECPTYQRDDFWVVVTAVTGAVSADVTFFNK